MPNSLASLEAAALMLSPEERAVLADHLLASLAVEQEVEEAWAIEIERRIAETESTCNSFQWSKQSHVPDRRLIEIHSRRRGRAKTDR